MVCCLSLQCFPTGSLGRQHHDLISHSVTFSWYWANQSLPYPNNAECLARKRQVSIFKWLVWLEQGLNRTISQYYVRQMFNAFSHPVWCTCRSCGLPAVGLVSQFGSTIKLPWVCAVKSRHLRCCQGTQKYTQKQQQNNNKTYKWRLVPLVPEVLGSIHGQVT